MATERQKAYMKRYYALNKDKYKQTCGDYCKYCIQEYTNKVHHMNSERHKYNVQLGLPSDTEMKEVKDLRAQIQDYTAKLVGLTETMKNKERKLKL